MWDSYDLFDLCMRPWDMDDHRSCLQAPKVLEHWTHRTTQRWTVRIPYHPWEWISFDRNSIHSSKRFSNRLRMSGLGFEPISIVHREYWTNLNLLKRSWREGLHLYSRSTREQRPRHHLIELKECCTLCRDVIPSLSRSQFDWDEWISSWYGVLWCKLSANFGVRRGHIPACEAARCALYIMTAMKLLTMTRANIFNALLNWLSEYCENMLKCLTHTDVLVSSLRFQSDLICAPTQNTCFKKVSF